MIRRFLLTLGLAAVLLTACQPGPTPTPPLSVAAAPTAIPTATAIPHGDAIRFALVGAATLTNVWAYYDQPGADYNNRAVQNGFWPSLFHLSPLTGTFEPYLSDGTISPLGLDSGYFASNVTLRPDLVWSDGTPLTAADVAFTVNTALTFRLGLDWASAYNPDVIYHAEAVDPLTVRFYFRNQPGIEDWQYGALQGPIVNAAYWEPKLANATALLQPNPELDKAIQKLQAEETELQSQLKDLLYQLNLLDAASAAALAKQNEIYDKQEEINAVEKQIADKQSAQDAVYAAAHQALYALDASGEPTFGPFRAASRGADEFVNTANPLFPFGAPHFDRAVYHAYPDETSALDALAKGAVNVVLKQNGLTDAEQSARPLAAGITPIMPQFPRSDIRLLAFNLSNPSLSETNLRQAIACLATQHFFPTSAYYPSSLIVSKSGFGYTDAALFACAGLDAQARLEHAVGQLEAAGYTWDVKPSWDGAAQPGSGLRRAGSRLPAFTILVEQQDALRAATASAIAGQLEALGLDARVEQADASDVLYRVFDSHQFDMVILGWRLARYPAYLCDLFGPGNPYSYARAELAQNCDAFRSALDLGAAQQEAQAIQSLLAGDAPVTPLYSDVGYDAYAGVTYPFDETLDGIAGLYGAPGLAMPSVP